MKLLKYFFEFIFIYILFLIFKIIGYKKSSNLGEKIGKFCGPFTRSKKKIINNLKYSNIGVDDLEREIIIQYTQKNSDYGSYIDKNSYSIIKGVGNDFNKIYTFFSQNSSDNNKISLIDSDFTDSFNKDTNLSGGKYFFL